MTQVPNLRNQRSQPLAHQVYTALHQKILTFELKPYQALSETLVSEMLGVSRTPAREALTKLAEDKFVDIVPQRGTRVAPLREEDLDRSQFMREALELALLRRAMSSGNLDALVQELRKQITLQQTYVNFEDTKAFYAADEAFHALIAEYAKLPSVLPEILRVKDHMDRFRHMMVESVEDLNTVISQHRDIVDTIEAGDAEGAERSMIVHLRRIFDYVDEARGKFPEYFEAVDGKRAGARR